MKWLLSALIICTSLIVTNISIFAEQIIKGEAAFSSNSTDLGYIDYIASNVNIAGNMNKFFYYGDNIAYNNSNWFYFYQVESQAPDSYILSLYIHNLNNLAITSVGYFASFDMEATPFDHNVVGEVSEGTYAYDYYPNKMLLTGSPTTLNVGFGSNPYFLPYGTESRILFISSDNAPDMHDAELVGIEPDAPLLELEGELPAPSAVPEPSVLALFIYGLIHMTKKWRR